MKVLRTIITLILAMIIGLVLTRGLIAKAVLVNGVGALTGLKMNAGQVSLGILKGLVSINEMKLYNPYGFPDPVMADVPELYIDYIPASLLRGKAHFEEVRINLREFYIIRDRSGNLNLDALKTFSAAKAAVSEKEVKPEKKKGDFRIDTLYLKIGTVVYKDYSKDPLEVKKFAINLNERYENVTDPKKLVNLIVVRALVNTTIDQLLNLDISALKGNVQGVLSKGIKVLGNKSVELEKAVEEITGKIKGLDEAGKTGTDFLKGILDKANKALEDMDVKEK